MPPPDPSADAARRQEPAALAEAGTYPTADEGFDHGLVVLAMGQPYWLMPSENGYRLLVEGDAAERARAELACFDRESAGWPPRTPAEAAPARRIELATPLLWGLLVAAAFLAQARWPGRWEELGALDSKAVFGRGEWWRLATALFLHADAVHLLSNLIGGVFVFSAVLTTFGRRRGWLLLALASVAGNFGAVLLHHSEPYASIGASTAIFAGLGLLTGRAIRRARRAGGRRRSGMFVPLAAGVGCLALYGTGGFQVDTVAHGTGFAAGLCLGLLSALLREASGERTPAGGDAAL